MNKQHRLNYELGITNVPNDAACPDNALSVASGMVFHDDAYHVIQRPKMYCVPPNNGKLIFVHKIDTTDIYICVVEIQPYQGSSFLACAYCSRNVGALNIIDYLGKVSDSEWNYKYEEGSQICATGSCLIIVDSKGTHYFIWKGQEYKMYETIPDLNISFYLDGEFDVSGEVVNGHGIQKSGSFSSATLYNAAEEVEDLRVDESKQEDYNNMVVGLYNKNKKAIAHKKAFTEPFMVRAALEMYDGNFVCISQPILMFPTVTMNSYGKVSSKGRNTQLYTRYSKLYCTQNTDFSDFRDLIKNVVLFVSEGIDIYDLNTDQPFEIYEINDVLTNGIEKDNNEYIETSYNRPSAEAWSMLKKRTEAEITKDIKDTSIFYKICEIGIKPVQDLDTSEKMQSSTLENITTQSRIKEDDYFSRSRIKGKHAFVYNRRLMMANIERSLFEGYGNFLPYDNPHVGEEPPQYDFYVTVKTNSRDVIVKHSEKTWQKQGIFFFYPDRRATHVVIKKNGYTILNEELTEHSGFNGAYWLRGLPQKVEPETTIIQAQITEDANLFEQMLSTVIQSEVDNPFIFLAKGYTQVGTGNVVGISVNTHALSQGQYGQHPVIVFEDDAIWPVAINNEGYLAAVDQPIGREVCNNPLSITQTDDAVFFSSEKGLMRITGRDVVCVSEQLNGKNGELGSFQQYLRNAFIAYDYRDSLLWIINPNHEYSPGIKYHWVYSMKSGAFAIYLDLFYWQIAPSHVINNYPDTLIQSSIDNRKVYSLLTRDNINEDPDNNYVVGLQTRPIKFDNGQVLKTIMRMKSTYDLDGGGLIIKLEASNDLDNWFEIRHLRGKPWKYYRLTYSFSSITPAATFTGTTFDVQERRTNKLR